MHPSRLRVLMLDSRVRGPWASDVSVMMVEPDVEEALAYRFRWPDDCVVVHDPAEYVGWFGDDFDFVV